ncbi:MAG TPA: ABC transporter ATP-binding protein, partial [Anaerolineae bacterium]|nr:ABC transporter ATP-binding protein [Anaerolineae bacterium]
MSDVASIICVEKLTRRFKQTSALRDLDLSIERGEIFGLVGPDGAGKTTTLRLMAAVMNPTAGTVTVAGHDSVKHAEQIRAHVGYMPQRFSLYGDLSVQENLEFYADIFGVHGPERHRRFEQVLTFAHMTPFTDRRASALSGGMQKKLGLACTLIHRPDVLLLDEPTTGVDPVSRREFWDILTELHLHGTTIVLSTPYMDEAERCNRIGLLFKGQLIELGTPKAIKAMVRGQVLELQPSSLAEAQAALTAQPDVLEVQVYGNLLHVFVDNAEVSLPRLVRASEAIGVLLNHPRVIQ